VEAKISLPENDGGAPVTLIKYQVLTGSPEVYLTFDDRLRLDVATSDRTSSGLRDVLNWGIQSHWSLMGVFEGKQPLRYFARTSEKDLAVRFFGGSDRQLRLGTPVGVSKTPAAMMFGPPYALAFWIKMDSTSACFDIFRAASTSQRWDAISVWVRGYVQKDPYGFPSRSDQEGMLDRSDKFGNHIIVSHKPRNDGNAIVGRISSQPLPMGEWRYVVIRCEKATNFRHTTSMTNIATPLLKLSVLSHAADAASLLDIGKVYSKHWGYYEDNWGNRAFRQTKKTSRDIVIGGRYMCKTNEGPAGFGSFSLSDFAMHTSKVPSDEELLNGFRYGSIRSQIEIQSPTNAAEATAVVPLSAHLPVGYKGMVSAFVSVCNSFGCTPRAGGTLSAPAPPRNLNGTVSSSGEPTVAFSPPTESGGTPLDQLSYKFSEEKLECDIHKLVFGRDDIAPRVWTIFDAERGINEDGMVPEDNTDVKEWYSLEGKGRKFKRAPWASTRVGVYKKSGIEGKPGVHITTTNEGGRMDTAFLYSLPHDVDGAAPESGAIYVVGQRTSGHGRLVSSNSANWLFGWWHDRVSCYHDDRWAGNHHDHTETKPRGSRQTRVRVHSSRLYGRSNGEFLTDGHRTAKNAITHTNMNAPDKIQLGGWKNNHQKATGEINTVLIFLPNLESDAHDLVTAYLAWKWKKWEHWSAEEKALFGTDGCVFPVPGTTCAMKTDDVEGGPPSTCEGLRDVRLLRAESMGASYDPNFQLRRVSTISALFTPPGGAAGSGDVYVRAPFSRPFENVGAATHWRIATASAFVMAKGTSFAVSNFDLMGADGNSLLPSTLWDEGAADGTPAEDSACHDGYLARYVVIRNFGFIQIYEVQAFKPDQSTRHDFVDAAFDEKSSFWGQWKASKCMDNQFDESHGCHSDHRPHYLDRRYVTTLTMDLGSFKCVGRVRVVNRVHHRFRLQGAVISVRASNAFPENGEESLWEEEMVEPNHEIYDFVVRPQGGAARTGSLAVAVSRGLIFSEWRYEAEWHIKHRTTVDECPYGTFVFHSGSHCCRVNLDKNGEAQTYSSTGCKGNNFFDCPHGGPQDGNCIDTYSSSYKQEIVDRYVPHLHGPTMAIDGVAETKWVAMATRSAAPLPSFRTCVEASAVWEGGFNEVTAGRDFLVGRREGGNWGHLPTGCALPRGAHHQAAHWNRRQRIYGDKGNWKQVPGMPAQKNVASQSIWMGMVFDTPQSVVSGKMSIDGASLYLCSDGGNASSHQACTGLTGNTYVPAKCVGGGAAADPYTADDDGALCTSDASPGTHTGATCTNGGDSTSLAACEGVDTGNIFSAPDPHGLVLQRSMDGGESWQTLAKHDGTGDVVTAADVTVPSAMSAPTTFAVAACNRFGCSEPIKTIVKPPLPPTFTSLRVLSGSLLEISFESAPDAVSRGSDLSGFQVTMGPVAPLLPGDVVLKSVIVAATASDGSLTYRIDAADAVGGNWSVGDYAANEVRLWVRLQGCSVLGCSDEYTERSTGGPEIPAAVRAVVADEATLSVSIEYPANDNGLLVTKYQLHVSVFAPCEAACDSPAALMSGAEEIKTIETDVNPAGGAVNFSVGSTAETTVSVKAIPTCSDGGDTSSRFNCTGVTGNIFVPATCSVGEGAHDDDETACVGAGGEITPASCSERPEADELFVLVKVHGHDVPNATSQLACEGPHFEYTGSPNPRVFVPGVDSRERIRVRVSACNPLGCTEVPRITWNVDMKAQISPVFTFDKSLPDAGKGAPGISWNSNPDPAIAARGGNPLTDYARPLSMVLHFEVPYTMDLATTIRRAPNFDFDASRADVITLPLAANAEGTGIVAYEGGDASCSKDAEGVQTDDAGSGYTVEEGVAIYEILGVDVGTYELHALTRCPDASHNTWRVRLQGIGAGYSDWHMPVYGEDVVMSQWDIFSGGTWDIIQSGATVWIELKADEPGCLLEKILFNNVEHDNRLVRGRNWPPPVGAPILQAYVELPHQDNTATINLTSVWRDIPFFGMVPVHMSAQICLLSVQLPAQGTRQALYLTGKLAENRVTWEDNDLESHSPNVVTTVGWSTTQHDGGNMVNAVGWDSSVSTDAENTCSNGQSGEVKTPKQACPVYMPDCFTRHGPFKKHFGSLTKTWDLSTVQHTEVSVSLRLWFVDSWDGEEMKVLIDDQEVFASGKLYFMSFANLATQPTFPAAENGFTNSATVPALYQSCSYEPFGNYGHAWTVPLSFHFQHFSEEVKLEVTFGCDQGATDEAFYLDQVHIKAYAPGNDLRKHSKAAMNLHEDILAKCAPPSNVTKLTAAVGPPTQIVQFQLLESKLGSAHLQWAFPRSWGWMSAAQERTFILEFHGLVTGRSMGSTLVEAEPGQVAGDNTVAEGELGGTEAEDAGAADENSTNATALITAEGGSGEGEGEADLWAVESYAIRYYNGTCLDCFNHTGSLVTNLTHIRDMSILNLFAGTRYRMRIRAVTSGGGKGPWSEDVSVVVDDFVVAPKRIFAEPTLVSAEPESMVISWQVPDWQGSPVTHLRIQRSLVGLCGLTDLDWDTEFIVPVNYHDHVNMPVKSQHILTRVDGLSSDTEYVYRALSRNNATNGGAWASQFSPCCSYSLKTSVSNAFVDVSPTSAGGNDTMCEKNKGLPSGAKKFHCATIHGAHDHNPFENVMLQLHPGEYLANDPEGGRGAIMFQRKGMGLSGTQMRCTNIQQQFCNADSDASVMVKTLPTGIRELLAPGHCAPSDQRYSNRIHCEEFGERWQPRAIIDCGQRTCIDIISLLQGEASRTFAPTSLRKLTFRNASADKTGNRRTGFGSHGKRGALSGAVIRLAGPYDPEFTGIEITDCVFELNSAMKNGGAIFADCSDHPFDLRMQDVLFLQNTAWGDVGMGGGALSVQNCTTSLTFVAFEGNRAPSGGGGAARFYLGSATMTTVKAIENVASGPDGGGAFHVTSASMVMQQTAAVLNADGTRDKVLNNLCLGNRATHALGDGGACIMASYANVIASGWNVTGNYAHTEGGAVRCKGAKMKLTEGHFQSNSASRDGGGVSGMLCEMELEAMAFAKNVAGSDARPGDGVGLGGAIYLGPGSGSVVLSSTFTANLANSGGGAFACSNCDSSVVMFDTSFTDNTASTGGAVYMRESLLWLRGLGWSQVHASAVCNALEIVTPLPTPLAEAWAEFSHDMSGFVSVGQELLLANGDLFTSNNIGPVDMRTLITDEDVETGQVALVHVVGYNASLNARRVRLRFVEGMRPPIGYNATEYTRVISENGLAPSALQASPATPAQILQRVASHIQNYPGGMSLHRTSKQQRFLRNQATSSGGGAVFWDSPDEAHAPIVEPVKGAALFYQVQTSNNANTRNGNVDGTVVADSSRNLALYGADFASAGSKLVGKTLYLANNTIPFSPVVRLIDHYGQTVVNTDRSQSVTVFAQAIDKVFGKTDSTLNTSGVAYFPTLGMAAEPGQKNCSFISSSSRIADFYITVHIHQCLSGEFLRNQDAEVRADYASYLTSLVGTDGSGVPAIADLRFDEPVPCLVPGRAVADDKRCRWECNSCPKGRFSDLVSAYTCKACPTGFFQPLSSQVMCETCPTGRYARSEASTVCAPSEVDNTLPQYFRGLRFQAMDDTSVAQVKVIWDEPIGLVDTEGVLRGDVQGIQVRISLGNAASFESRLVTDINIPVTNTSAVVDLSDPATEAKCRIATGSNEPCAPMHEMKYYTQVRLYTNDGKVGMAAFPASTWAITTECTDRQFLDDFSCPFCESMRSDLESVVATNPDDQDALARLDSIPTVADLALANAPGGRLSNPLMWACTECPNGAACTGNILYPGIVGLFGWWRVELGARPEMFQRCLYPPACLGAPNSDMAGRFYDGNCIEVCRSECASRAALVGEEFDEDNCNFECGYDSECDLALVSIAECGSGAFWGKERYTGTATEGGWPGHPEGGEESLLVEYQSFELVVRLGSEVLMSGKEMCAAAPPPKEGVPMYDPYAADLPAGMKTAALQDRTAGKHDGARMVPNPPAPLCNEFTERWGDRAGFFPVFLEAVPSYPAAATPPGITEMGPDYLRFQYRNENGTVFSSIRNTSARICKAYKWVRHDLATARKVGDELVRSEGGLWVDMSMNVCPSADTIGTIVGGYGNGEGDGDGDASSSSSSSSSTSYPNDQFAPGTPSPLPRPEFSAGAGTLVRDRGEWIVYDTETIQFWDNVTELRYTEVRGYVYAAFDADSDALKSTTKPELSQLVEHPGASANRVRLDAASTDANPTGGASMSVKKTQIMKCNMGFKDPTTAHLYSRCDRSKGLVCEVCNRDFGYMEDCVNPVGSRCRLCAACASGFKRAGEARCKRCPAVTANRVLMAVGVLAMILAAAILIYMAIEAADAKENVSDAMKKIMINYLQVTSLAAGFPLKWPEPVEQMFAAMSAISSAGQHILSPDCELSWMEPAAAFYAKQVLFASMPVVIFLCSKFTWIFIKCAHHCVMRRAAKGKKCCGTGCPRTCQLRHPLSFYGDRAILTDVVFFYFLYPTMVKQAISLFACEAIGEKWYLSADLQEECLVGRHMWWLTMFGLPQLGAYVFGMPFIAYLILLANRWRLHKKRVRFRYGLLYTGYRRRTFWWEGVVAMRKVTFVVIAGVFGSRMGPDLQCFVALFVLFWFFNFHLTAHPFDEISTRHRALHHMETWALIVSWCTMWMGLIFYLGNEFGRINREWMVVFTVGIIGMNVLYSSVVMFLFFKEYIQEKIEAKKVQDHEKMVHKLAAHMYQQQQIEASMSPGPRAAGRLRTKMKTTKMKEGETLHSLNPRRVGRDSLGGDVLQSQLSAEGIGPSSRRSGRDLMADSAANVLSFTKTKLSKGKQHKTARKMQKMLMKKAMTDEQMDEMDKMLIGQRALESVSEAFHSKGEKIAKIKEEQTYQKGRLERRLKVRLLERKMGLSKKDSEAKRKAAKVLLSGKPTLFGKIMHRNQSKLANRIKILSNINASMHKARHEVSHAQYLRVKFWGMPTGITFKKSRDGYALEISSVKKGSSMCPAEGRSVLKTHDVLIDVNGKDVRGSLASATKDAYRTELRAQSNRSMSEDPPMWYLIFRRGAEAADDDMQSTTELARRYEVIAQFNPTQMLEQQEEVRRARNNVTSGATTEAEEMNADDARNSINDVNLKRDLKIVRKGSLLNKFRQKVMPSVRKHMAKNQADKEVKLSSSEGHEGKGADLEQKREPAPTQAGAEAIVRKQSAKASWEEKIGAVLCSTRVDPETGKVIDSGKRKEKLAGVKGMLKKYKGKESKLLINYLKKYQVPKEEGRKIVAM
jgi:hypothetical protein